MRNRGRRVAALTFLAAVVVLAALAIVSKDLLLERWFAWRLGSSDPAVRESAGRRLAAMGSPLCVPFVLQAMEDKGFDPGRFEPVGASGDAPLTEGQEDLRWIRDYWARAGERAVPLLLDAWDSGNSSRRTTIQMALLGLGSSARSASAGLIARMWQGKPFDRAEAAAALWRLESLVCPECVEALTAALDDPEPMVRMTAAGSLMHFGAQAKGSLDALLRRVKDVDPNVRLSAMMAISALPDTQAAGPAALESLRDPFPPVRLIAAHHVLDGKYGTEAMDAAVPVLEGLLSDQMLGTRKDAAEYLGDLGARALRAVPLLERASKSDPEPQVRDAAANALEKIEAARGPAR
jgi:HEAT repeat protein